MLRKCLEILGELFPEATVYALLHKNGSVSETISLRAGGYNSIVFKNGGSHGT